MNVSKEKGKTSLDCRHKRVLGQ